MSSETCCDILNIFQLKDLYKGLLVEIEKYEIFYSQLKLKLSECIIKLNNVLNRPECATLNFLDLGSIKKGLELNKYISAYIAEKNCYKLFIKTTNRATALRFLIDSTEKLGHNCSNDIGLLRRSYKNLVDKIYAMSPEEDFIQNLFGEVPSNIKIMQLSQHDMTLDEHIFYIKIERIKYLKQLLIANGFKYYTWYDFI